MTFHVTIERDARDPETGAIPGLERLYEDPDVTVSHLADDRGPELASTDLQGADAYVSYSYDLTADSLAGVESLDIVTRAGAGYENLDLDALTEHGIVAAHAPQGPTASAAQATVGMIIACAHDLARKEHRLRTEGWGGRAAGGFGFELGNATLGFIGLGLIGQQVLENLEPFRSAGLRTLVYDPYLGEQRADALGVELVDRGTLLSDADVVTIHVPLTDETHHMLGPADFERMQSSAYLVNTARGGIYPDEALADALEAGEIAGAAVDVFEDEPDVSGNPLLGVDHAMLTPHVAGVTVDSLERIHSIMAESIHNIKAGEPPINVLNPAAYEAVAGEPLPEESVSPSFRP